MDSLPRDPLRAVDDRSLLLPLAPHGAREFGPAYYAPRTRNAVPLTHAFRPLPLIAAAVLAALIAAPTVHGHQGSAADHPSGCVAWVEPQTVAVGDAFTLSGEGYGAEIEVHVTETEAIPEDARPVVTITEGSGISLPVTLNTEPGDEGGWFVTALMPGTSCADRDTLTVLAEGASPGPSPADTAQRPSILLFVLEGVALLAAIGAGVVFLQRARAMRRQP